MRIGLQQHLHCAVFRTYPDEIPSAGSMEKTIGPECRTLVPLMQQHVPGEYHVVMAHRCSYQGRMYAHVIARYQGHLISLLITKRQPGEHFDSASISNADAQRFSIAGFQTPEHLVYVVSDLGRQSNNSLVEGMASGIRTAIS